MWFGVTFWLSSRIVIRNSMIRLWYTILIKTAFLQWKNPFQKISISTSHVKNIYVWLSLYTYKCICSKGLYTMLYIWSQWKRTEVNFIKFTTQANTHTNTPIHYVYYYTSALMYILKLHTLMSFRQKKK